MIAQPDTMFRGKDEIMLFREGFERWIWRDSNILKSISFDDDPNISKLSRVTGVF